MEDNKALDTTVVEVDTETTETTQEVKTFTQEELNKHLAKQKRELNSKMPSKEELKAFTDWQANQKTAEEKTAEAIKNLEAEKNKLSSELQTYKAEKTASKKGIIKEYVELAGFKALSMLTEDNDIESVIDELVKENPHWIEEKEKTITTGTQVKGKVSKDQTEADLKYMRGD